MSRSLAFIALLIATLAGCTVMPEQKHSAATPPDPDVLAYRALRDWLDKEQTVAAMKSNEEVVKELVKIGKPSKPDEWFYFGLLNQKLKTEASWIQARDAFREVSKATGITAEQRQLAAILELYNQSRINWYFEYREVQTDFVALQTELNQARQENGLLQQKIQAITDLETAISTRKEQ